MRLALLLLLTSLTACQWNVHPEPPDGLPPGEHLPPPPEYDDEGIQVSPAGDDASGDGSAERPYRTIGHVLRNVAQAGDTLILRGGEYEEEVRIRLPGITLRSHSGEWAVISQPISTDPNDSPLTVRFDVEAHGSRLQRVEVKGGYYAVVLHTAWEQGVGGSGVQDVTIEDSVIHSSGRDCIKVNPKANGFTMRRTRVYNSGAGYPAGTSTDDKNAEGIDVVNADDVHIQDSWIHDTATTGIYVKGGGRGTLIERTLVERTGAMGIALGFDTSPEWFDLEANPDYFENINGTVRNNIVRDAGGAGIAMYAALNPLVINNTVIDTAQTYHAPIYFGLTFQDWAEEAGRPATRNPRVHNNIVSQPTSGNCVAIRQAHEPSLGGDLPAVEGGVAFSHNLYFAGNGTCRFSDGRHDFSGDLEAWKVHVGATDSHEADPRLTEDGHLQADSPAIGAGLVDPAVTLDFDGDVRDATNDIGADQH
ncbi:MAG TPA: right-handed parallel beta-helix repeat-containing protein [Myxococcaceae bacterium]|nr:right-handed parallel beta-helix repeat-containing protein [Myxococcaceae bacterium]